jgi:cobaltochelatase CobN
LIDKAIRLVSSVQEEANYVREGTLATEARLIRRGMAPAEARSLAATRIFGTKPGNLSGTNILYLVPRSGVWDKSGEVAGVYIDNMSFAYGGDVWGRKIDGLYQEAIQGTDLLVRVWASNMTSQLSNHHAYEYLGGLSMAVKQLTGKEPQAYIADVRDPNRARMREFTEVMATTFSTELLNKRWVEGMKEHGYAGAGHVAELVKNTFGWSVTRGDGVSDETWRQIYSVYVEDKYNLGIAKWMEESNPHALQELSATMLEAARKGYWNASAETVASLSKIYARSVVEHGDSGGLVSGGNRHLAEYVGKTLRAPGNIGTAALASSMGRALAAVRHPPAPPPLSMPRLNAPVGRSARAAGAAAISGLKLELARSRRAPPPVPVFTLALVCACMFALVWFGYYRRQGAL